MNPPDRAREQGRVFKYGAYTGTLGERGLAISHVSEPDHTITHVSTDEKGARKALKDFHENVEKNIR